MMRSNNMDTYDEDDDLSMDLPIPPCCRCIRSTLLSILTFALMAASLIVCSVSLSMATNRTKELLGSGENYSGGIVYGYQRSIHVALTGVARGCRWVPVVMLVLGGLYLVLAVLSSFPHSYSGSRNICTRAANVLVVVLLVVLQCVWILITSGLMVPVAMFLLFKLFVQILDVTRMNMKEYYTLFLLTEEHYRLQGFKLQNLESESHDIFKLYAIAFLSSMTVTVCFTFYSMCATANYKHLKKHYIKKERSPEETEVQEDGVKQLDDSDLQSYPLMTYVPATPTGRLLTPPHLLMPHRPAPRTPPSRASSSRYRPSAPPPDALDDVDAAAAPSSSASSGPLLNGSIVHQPDTLTPLPDRRALPPPLPERKTAAPLFGKRLTLAGARDAVTYLRTYLDTYSNNGAVFNHLTQIEVVLDQLENTNR